MLRVCSRAMGSWPRGARPGLARFQGGCAIPPGGQATPSPSAAGPCGVETAGDAWHGRGAEAPWGLEGAGRSDGTTSGLAAAPPARSAGSGRRRVLVGCVVRKTSPRTALAPPPPAADAAIPRWARRGAVWDPRLRAAGASGADSRGGHQGAVAPLGPARRGSPPSGQPAVIPGQHRLAGAANHLSQFIMCLFCFFFGQTLGILLSSPGSFSFRGYFNDRDLSHFRRRRGSLSFSVWECRLPG